MTSKLKYTYLLMMLSTLSGCTLFSNQHVIYDRDQDYLKANSTQPLVIPPGVDASQLGNKYPVPGTEYPTNGQAQSMLPPGSLAEQKMLQAPTPPVVTPSQVQPPIGYAQGAAPNGSNSGNVNAGANALMQNQQRMLTRQSVGQANGSYNSNASSQIQTSAPQPPISGYVGGTSTSPMVPKSVGGNSQTPGQSPSAPAANSGSGISSTPNLSSNAQLPNQRGIISSPQVTNLAANGSGGSNINSSSNVNGGSNNNYIKSSANINGTNTYSSNSYVSVNGNASNINSSANNNPGNINGATTTRIATTSIAGSPTTSQNPSVNQNIITGQLASLNQNQSATVGSEFSNYPYLIEQQSIYQVWPNMVSALQTAGYKIMVQDRKVNTYYFLDPAATNGTITIATPLYQIHASPTVRGNTSLIVTDNSGKPIDIGTAKVVLENIQYGLEGKSPPVINEVKRWAGL